MPRTGLIGLADDLLPRYDRTKTLTDSPVVRIQGYWPEENRSELIALAHQVSLDKFLKLHVEENRQRLLESLWRSVRGQFSFRGGELGSGLLLMQIIIQRLDRGLIRLGLFHNAFKMSLIMSQWSYRKTTTNRQSTGGESTASRRPRHRGGTTASRASSAASGLGVSNPRANGGYPGRGSGHSSTPPAALAPVGTVSGRRGPDGVGGARRC